MADERWSERRGLAGSEVIGAAEEWVASCLAGDDLNRVWAGMSDAFRARLTGATAYANGWGMADLAVIASADGCDPRWATVAVASRDDLVAAVGPRWVELSAGLLVSPGFRDLERVRFPDGAAIGVVAGAAAGVPDTALDVDLACDRDGSWRVDGWCLRRGGRLVAGY